MTLNRLLYYFIYSVFLEVVTLPSVVEALQETLWTLFKANLFDRKLFLQTLIYFSSLF